MSAQPTNTTAPDLVTIEIDGRELKAPKGSMVIQAADRAGIAIPRFCYHEKLPIAANCRMCLVDVEKAPKPMPACATPVMDGMKVYTQSKRALDAQRNVMEFLLINHPLDCPICDQGGECELQDLSMGYGRSVSRFAERKRVIPDEDLGPLISTEMTRCIQCTRCIRVLDNVAGTCELGGMSRGEDLQIGTYIGKTIESEISGNVIDVCPVGALTNKVFRFRARPWELIARESLGYHDALGSNLFLHTRRGDVMRAVPRDNEAVNECWLSDRDRYSHQGLDAGDRLTQPMVRDGATWRETDWDEAIARAASLLKSVPGDELGFLVHPATSNEEGALLAAIAQGLGSGHIDHRLRALDLADAPVGEAFERPVAEIEKADVIVLVGSNIRHEVPLLSHRIRKAVRGGAKVYAINPVDFDLNFALAGATVVPPSKLVDAVLRVAHAASSTATPPAGLAEHLGRAAPDEAATAIAKALAGASAGVVLVGDIAQQHPQASWLRALSRHLARATGAALCLLPMGANAVGLSRAGVLPAGRNARAMTARSCRGYVLYGIEPQHDFADGAEALRAIDGAEHVVAFSAYVTDSLRRVAEVILPIALLPEMDATLTNLDGRVQRAIAAGKAPGDARAGWRVLRALGGRLELPGFDFVELTQLRQSMSEREVHPGEGLSDASAPEGGGLERIATVAIYRTDAVLRRATALNAHPLTRGPCAMMHPEDALAAGVSAGAMAKFDSGRGTASLPVAVDRRVPRGAVWIESGYEATAPIAPAARLNVTRA